MNIVKTRFHNKMEDDILINYLILYIKIEMENFILNPMV